MHVGILITFVKGVRTSDDAPSFYANEVSDLQPVGRTPALGPLESHGRNKADKKTPRVGALARLESSRDQSG